MKLIGLWSFIRKDGVYAIEDMYQSFVNNIEVRYRSPLLREKIPQRSKIKRFIAFINFINRFLSIFSQHVLEPYRFF
jgi:hypothetical protein